MSHSDFLTQLRDVSDFFCGSQQQVNFNQNVQYYFKSYSAYESKVDTLTNKIQQICKQMDEVKNPQTREQLSAQIKHLDESKLKLAQEIDAEQAERRTLYDSICDKVVALCVGHDKHTTEQKMKAVLGFLLMLTPNNNLTIPSENLKRKPLYRAVIALLLLKELAENHPSELEKLLAFNNTPKDFYSDQFKTDIVKPTVMAAIMLDTGLWHQDALNIFTDDNNVIDEFKPLSVEDRKRLLKVNYKQTQRFIFQGVLGAQAGSDHAKNGLVKAYMSGIIDQTSHVGSLMKVAQLYSGFLLPTKRNYQYTVFPMTLFILKKRVEPDGFMANCLDILLNKIGMYPLGYGVCFVKVNEEPTSQSAEVREQQADVEAEQHVAEITEQTSSPSSSTLKRGVVCDFASGNSTSATVMLVEDGRFNDEVEVVTSEYNLFLPSARETFFPNVESILLQAHRIAQDEFNKENQKIWVEYCFR